MAYYFGRALHRTLQVPIGLIHSSWGGTGVETWTSPETMLGDEQYAPAAKKLQATDLEQEQAGRVQTIRRLMGDLPSQDEGLVNGKALFADPTLNEDDWGAVDLPHQWPALVDGTGWYRNTFTLTAAEAAHTLIINLSSIDDRDITWVNGQKVGALNSSNDKRVYEVRSTVLKEGLNHIAIRVTDGGGQGGINGRAEEIYIQTKYRRLPLLQGWKHRITSMPANVAAIKPSDYPSLLYNGMISPLTPYGIQGVIWYQGEGNVYRPVQYRRLFPQLIEDWRERWNQGNFPFLFVSLANFKASVDTTGESFWAELREAQTLGLQLERTGMVTTIDIGDAEDIHPKNKQEVGRRLALQALKLAYQQDVVHTGPVLDTVEYHDGYVLLTFKETGSGLLVKNRYGYINGFSIAGSDKKFYWARAILTGNNTVRVMAGAVASPVAVRYGWADNPGDLNLYNREGLPVHPFRTDDWPGISQGR